MVAGALPHQCSDPRLTEDEHGPVCVLARHTAVAAGTARKLATCSHTA